MNTIIRLSVVMRWLAVVIGKRISANSTIYGGRHISFMLRWLKSRWRR
jgi:hypothetical protein